MEAVYVCAGIFVAIVIYAYVSSEADEERRRKLAHAHAAYQTALTKLKQQPTDATCRQLALDAGRTYSNLTRESKGVTLFDEMALKNDLDAAAAGAGAGAPTMTAPTSVPETPSVADRLGVLGDLKARGLITEEEFQARRTKVLEGVRTSHRSPATETSPPRYRAPSPCRVHFGTQGDTHLQNRALKRTAAEGEARAARAARGS